MFANHSLTRSLTHSLTHSLSLSLSLSLFVSLVLSCSLLGLEASQLLPKAMFEQQRLVPSSCYCFFSWYDCLQKEDSFAVIRACRAPLQGPVGPTTGLNRALFWPYHGACPSLGRPGSRGLEECGAQAKRSNIDRPPAEGTAASGVIACLSSGFISTSEGSEHKHPAEGRVADGVLLRG